MKPFNYQSTAIENTLALINQHQDNFLALIVALATGAGKTLVYNEVIKRFRNQYPLINGQRPEILVVSHDEKLISQGEKNFKQICPTAMAGIFSGKTKSTHCCVTYATIQSAGRKATRKHSAQTDNDLLSKLLQDKPIIHLLIIDECHRVSTTEDAQYNTLIKVLRANNPNLKVLGLTATPYRDETGYLWEDNDSIWRKENIVYNNAYGEGLVALFNEGYLVRPVTKLPQEIRMECNVKRNSNGDYSESAIEQANADKFEAIARDAIPKLAGRKKILVFVSSIKIANDFHRILLDLKQDAVIVHGKQNDAKNKAAFAQFERGTARFLVSVSKTTTGYDFPLIDALLMLRPTVVTSLYVQMIGRLTRRACDISHCTTKEQRLEAIANSVKPFGLVLDYTTNIYECGTLANPLIKKAKAKKAEIPIKTCGNCFAVIDIKEKSCPHCGYEFEALPEIQPVITDLTLVANDAPLNRDPSQKLQNNHIDIDIVGGQNQAIIKQVKFSFLKKEIKVNAKGQQYFQLFFFCTENGKQTSYRDALFFEGYSPAAQRYNVAKWQKYTNNSNTPTTAQEANQRFIPEMKKQIKHLTIDCEKREIIEVIQETTQNVELFD